MYKAKKEMAKTIQKMDVIIEILDARLPHSSANPMLQEMTKGTPRLRILNKADLAIPQITQSWQHYFNQQSNCQALINSLDKKLKSSEIVSKCQYLVSCMPPKKKYQGMIVGIPNVGKSTLINQILQRKVAKTGNEPAITKSQSRIKLSDKWTMSDTPGVLWPKMEDQLVAYRLASTGAIRNTAIESEDIALFVAEALQADFPDLLRSRYQLTEVPDKGEAILEAIALRRGCVGRNLRIDWHKVSELLLNDFRSGKLGRISLEKPDQYATQAPLTMPSNP